MERKNFLCVETNCQRQHCSDVSRQITGIESTVQPTCHSGDCPLVVAVAAAAVTTMAVATVAVTTVTVGQRTSVTVVVVSVMAVRERTSVTAGVSVSVVAIGQRASVTIIVTFVTVSSVAMAGRRHRGHQDAQQNQLKKSNIVGCSLVIYLLGPAAIATGPRRQDRI